MFAVFLERRAEKDLDNFPHNIRQLILKEILSLKDSPWPHGCKKLKGETHNWRLRVGDYRVLYEIDSASKAIKLYRIKHRREAYR